MQGLKRQSTRTLLAAAVTAAAPVWSISLGDVEVRSALGEPLDARVPLTLAPGEMVDATCFGLARDPEPGVPVLIEGLLTVERGADRTELRIRSSNSVFEPAMRIRVRAGCPGRPGETLRQYSLLLDPRRGDPVIANVPAIAATLDARGGDTLEGIATKVFPRNRAARDRYLQAMREVNPALSTLGATDAIPAGANVALPDLRTFGRASPAGTAVAQASRAIPAAEPKAGAASAPREKTARRKPRKERTNVARAESGHAVAAPSKAAAPGDFVLKLSGDAMDLSRTREVDDRTRAQLRERLMVLESDDQVAAVLALRNRLTQLEQRVNELQLKLAQMPASFPARGEAQQPAAAAQAPAPVAAAETAKLPVVAEAPTPSSTPAVAAEPPKEAAKEPAAEAKPEPAPAKSEPTKNEPTPGASDTTSSGTSTKAEGKATAAKPVMAGAKPGWGIDLRSLWQTYGLWALFIAVLSLLMLLVWRLTHRAEPEYTSEEDEAWEQPPATEPRMEGGEESFDAGATLKLAAPDAPELRRRYIEERFPEVTSGSLALDDPASVVKGARLLYEDGAAPRAIELLQFAIEEHPSEVRTWLALFEIYRLERLSAEFAELARRFFEHFGSTEYWRKIRYFGREIDPGNFLYREDVDALETIGPGARKPDERFDAARENWLDAPMDFDNQVLANELRQALMAGAGIVDQDLVPNPMPALRDAEMFTVA